MLSPQEFAAAWGEDRYLFSADQLRDISLPEASKTFLLEAGLPLSAEVPLGFYVVPLPVIPASPPVQAAKHPLLARYQSTGFRLLAYLYNNLPLRDERSDTYYVVEEVTGHIHKVGPWIDPGFFVNTSLSQFTESLLYYREFVTHFRPTEPERSQVPILVGSLEQKWREIDSTAMARPSNYWPRGIADMKMHL